MPVGASSLHAGLSYLTFGVETTWGTAVTATAGLDFLSASLKTQIDHKVLEQIETSRTYSKGISLSKVVGGSVDFYFAPEVTACSYLLRAAMGGTVTSATATQGDVSETIGAGAASVVGHTFDVGTMEDTNKGLSANLRKGEATNGFVFEYSGLRVNSLSFQADIDDSLICSMELVGKDSTQSSNDVSSNITATAYETLDFTTGRISIESTFASLTSTSFWHVQSVNLNINNNLKSGNESRRIGSNLLQDLNAGMQTYELSMDIRFDTTTAYDAMVAGTEFACELEFLGSTMTGSNLQRGLLLEMQKIKVKDAGDPELGGPDEILTSTVTFDVLRDESATGYALQATVYNQAASV